jgi:hypothetical protein
MPFFSKPIARIYVKELRTKLDSLVVPIFAPDTSIDVGDFGSFDDGQFVPRGNVTGRGLRLDVEESPVNAFEFASSGKVTIGPSVTVPNPAGGDLLKTVLSFTKSQAVVASFQGGVERSVSDADAFGESLMEFWYGKKLNKNRAVVWSVRRANGGTVLVSEDGDNKVEVVADSALLGPAGLTLAGLSVGVEFGAERKATWKLSSSKVPLVAWARLFRLSDDYASAVDAFGFSADSPELKAEVAGKRPVAFTADDLLGRL